MTWQPPVADWVIARLAVAVAAVPVTPFTYTFTLAWMPVAWQLAIGSPSPRVAVEAPPGAIE